MQYFQHKFQNNAICWHTHTNKHNNQIIAVFILYHVNECVHTKYCIVLYSLTHQTVNLNWVPLALFYFYLILLYIIGGFLLLYSFIHLTVPIVCRLKLNFISSIIDYMSRNDNKNLLFFIVSLLFVFIFCYSVFSCLFIL